MNVPTARALRRPRRVTGKIDLVEHTHRLQFPRQPVDDGPVGWGNAGTGVDDKKERIGVSDRLPSARDANCLNLVGSVSQTRGIDDIHGHAVDLNRLAYCITRGAGNFSDDGEGFSRHPVEGRPFSYLWLTLQHHLKPPA